MKRVDRLKIDFPCTADWNQMRGNERIRYCEECNKYVYDFARLPRRQVEEMMAASPGRICAKLTYKNNSLVFLDSKPRPRPESHRASPLAAAILTAMLGINTGAALPVMAAPLDPPSIVQNVVKAEAKKQETDGITASISGILSDHSDVAIAGATVMLVSEKTGKAQILTSNGEGRFRFSDLHAGRYTIQIEALKFESLTTDKISVQAGYEQTLNIKLDDEMVVLGGIGRAAQPLRSLYNQSHLVAVAQVGKSKKVVAREYGTTFRTEFLIKESLKGELEPAINIEHIVYEDEKVLKPGDNLIVFLRNPMPKNGKSAASKYEVVDGGFKKLTESEMGVYVARIRELESIMAAEKPDPHAIVEWLVRCAEDPATIMEGVTEIQWSFDLIQYEQEDEEREKVEAQKVKDTSEIPDANTIVRLPRKSSERAEDREPKLAFLLTPDQKKRLSSILFNGEIEKVPMLISIVSQWDAERLIPALIKSMRRDEEAAPIWTWFAVKVLRNLIDDEKVSESATEFLEQSTYEDVWEDQGDKVEEGDKTPLEAKQQRSKMLKDFLNKVEQHLKKRGATSSSGI